MHIEPHHQSVKLNLRHFIDKFSADKLKNKLPKNTFLLNYCVCVKGNATSLSDVSFRQRVIWPLSV